MYSDEIQECLGQLSVAHSGVYACDQLPHRVQVPSAIVVNADPHSRPGSHWLAIYIDINKELDFFDSYGRPPDQKFTHFIKRNSKVARYNITVLQDITSSVCGHYCVTFLYFKSQGILMSEFIDLFCNNSMENDRRITILFAEFFYQRGHKVSNNHRQNCRCLQRVIT